MVGAYVRMRQVQKGEEGSKKQFTHTSPRTLLGILRLSQALARLRFSDTVVTEDVDEALRIIDVSKASLYKDGRGQGTDMTPTTRIYQLVCNMRESGAAAVGSGARGELNMNRVRELVIGKGFTDEQFRKAIEEYEELDVSLPGFLTFYEDDTDLFPQLWQLANNGTRLVFVEAGDEDEDHGMGMSGNNE